MINPGDLAKSPWSSSQPTTALPWWNAVVAAYGAERAGISMERPE